jgi:hypothetical protein
MLGINAVVLAAAESEGPTLNSTGVVEWVVRAIIPLVLLAIGIGIIASARRGKLSDNANTLTNVFIGLSVIAGAGLMFGFAQQITDLMFSG